MNLITPTIGRKVWFRPNGSHIGVPGAAQPQSQAPAQAMDATVVLVHGDRMVNLLVLDHDGFAWPVRSVPLQQEGDATPHGMYAQWMPYQVKQAAQVEAAAKQGEHAELDFVGDEIIVAGDVVQLRSGGPLMTAECLNKTDAQSHEGSVTCVWQPDGFAQVRRDIFFADTLINITGVEELGELGERSFSADELSDNHARRVLYPAIRTAMSELGTLHPGFNGAVNRAFNHLHRAFWSEAPAPAGEPGLRPEMGPEGPWSSMLC